VRDIVPAIREALQELVAERDRVTARIETLEAALAALEGGSTPGRGRRRQTVAGGERKKPNWSPAAKEAARLRMKKYWADRKKAEGNGSKKTASKTRKPTTKSKAGSAAAS